MSATVTTPAFSAELISVLRNTGIDDKAAAARAEALQHFELLGLPGSKSEEYRFAPITKMLEMHFSSGQFVQLTPASISDISQYCIPEYPCNLVVFVNGLYHAELSKKISPDSQVRIQPLHEALEAARENQLDDFAKLVDSRADPFAALNTTAWSSGVHIFISPGVKVDNPIVILHLHDAEKQIVVSATRLLMTVGEKSEVSIVEKFDSSGSYPTFSSWVEEIDVKGDAILNYSRIQNDPGNAYQVTNTQIRQQTGSRVNTFTFSTNGQMVRNNFAIAVDGEKCESHFYGLYLLDGQTLVDNHTAVDHRQPNSFSNEFYKGIMDGNSKGVFNGKIYVRPHAQKTNAFQSNRNILLTDTATINTKPQLEIWADDVKCSHGCTSGQLDDEALFYLQSRGISKSSAKAMLLYAFASEILDPMQDQILKEYMRGLISQRLKQA